ncbi:MAG TPA: ABC transporter substrate-binding protein [Hyphomicrobiales bacterium]|nr:ABC transporter substrate-binding protein [Hyphomicrobiales bacterium]
MNRFGKWLLAAAVAAASTAMAGGASAQPLKQIKLMYTAVSGFTSAYVAQEEGFFKKHGLDVSFVLTPSSGNNPPALVSGSVQIAGPTMPTLLEANDAGLDLVVISGGAVYPLEADILVARYGSGIKSPKDLKGKTVGVPGLGALLDFMLRRNLKANGVDPSTVKFVEVGFVQAADALKSGRIDAYPAEAPFTARILQSKAGYAVKDWLADTPDGTLTVVYATTRKWAEANKDTVAAFRAAMKEAIAWIPAHHEEMYKDIAKYTHLPVKVVSSLQPPNLVVDVTPKQAKFWIDLVKDSGVIKKPVDPASILFQPDQTAAK